MLKNSASASNTQHLCYRDQSVVRYVLESYRSLFWEPKGTHRWTLRANFWELLYIRWYTWLPLPYKGWKCIIVCVAPRNFMIFSLSFYCKKQRHHVNWVCGNLFGFLPIAGQHFSCSATCLMTGSACNVTSLVFGSFSELLWKNPFY
jgi:hypothetical protein